MNKEDVFGFIVISLPNANDIFGHLKGLFDEKIGTLVLKGYHRKEKND
jgi:hypothetical protein